MTSLDLQKWSRANWDKLPAIVREDCLGQLRADLPPEVIARWKSQHAAGQEIGADDTFFHHGLGMLVRNILRKQITDGELLPVQHENYPPEGAKNWDDYYLGALLELVETTP